MNKYERPNITIVEANAELLTMSGPNADGIFSPTVSDDAKGHSVWDEVNDTYNINKEENNGEDWI